MAKMDRVSAMFLRQSMEDCFRDFDYIRTHRRAVTWDWLVVTASNAEQAAAYQLQIEQRLENGWLPKQTRYIVVPDPGGKRVGNGGATLNVLREIAQALGGGKPFDKQRILVLHSGGDSKRVPQYSACGKLFSRVPRALPDGRASTLFDEFCIALAGVPARMASGMLVMSGDVLLLFNALQIDLELSGAACLSIKAPVETGTHHGVFLPDADGMVRHFLHKLPREKLYSLGAVNAQHAVDVDTGAIWLDTNVLDALYGLIAPEGVFSAQVFARFVDEDVRLSFYGDFLYPMATGATLEDYLTQAPEFKMSDALLACRRELWEALSSVKLRLIRLSPAKFIHFGTTGELRELMCLAEQTFDFIGWRRDVQSVFVPEGCAAIHCECDVGAQVAPGCYLEDSRVGEMARIGEGCVLSNAVFGGELPAQTALHALPLSDGRFVARVYGVDDNPKDGLQGAYLGTTLASFLQTNGLAPSDIFASSEQTLWTAKLYPVCADMAQAMAGVETVLRMAQGIASPAERESWRACERMSLHESFAAADMRAVLAWQAVLEDAIRAKRFVREVANGAWVKQALDLLSEGDAGLRQMALIERDAKNATFPLQHRLYYALTQAADVAGGSDAPVRREQWEDACFQSINDHLFDKVAQRLPALATQRMQCDCSEVALPVRINFGGGWSDTPPYCLEHGGTVLNAAVSLAGKLPVRAVASRIDAPCIRIISDDLKVSVDYGTIEALSHASDPQDPHALCKAGLIACGLIPLHGKGPLAPLLQAWGGGLCIRTSVAVPKGSGLGTSSILAAAVAQALSRLFGQSEDAQRIVELALCMEQIMSTGGGWQDQVGGLYLGLKLTTTYPGIRQELHVHTLELLPETLHELQTRLSLVYTGQRRLARNILRDIVGKVIGGDPETHAILARIQRLAALMAYELERGDIGRFCELLREHWAESKALDSASSNTCIDQLIAVCEDMIDGVMICGAGGGGFLMLIRKPGVSEDALRDRIGEVFQESGVEVWQAELIV